MTASIFESLSSQLQQQGIPQISRQLGIDERRVSQVVAGALPAMVGGLARNSTTSQGAQALTGALDRDHDGSVLDDVVGFLSGGGAGAAGAGILGHVFGNRQGSLERSLGATSGLDSSQVGQILTMLAPLVMGALGRTRRSQGLDAGSLASVLQREARSAGAKSPGEGDMLSRLLDADGDGSALDDVAQLGAGFLGKVFGGR